jgi:hypothetical protein
MVNLLDQQQISHPSATCNATDLNLPNLERKLGIQLLNRTTRSGSPDGRRSAVTPLHAFTQPPRASRSGSSVTSLSIGTPAVFKNIASNTK